MAHTNKLTSWLIENAEQINLQATEMTWVSDWRLRGYHDFQVKIDVAGKTFVGRGTAFGEDLAFLKAGAEAIERAYCAGHDIHSTGVAAHTDDAAAKENAKNELNERDAFFCHFYTKTPFLPLPNSNIHQLMDEYRGVFNEILPLGINIQLFRACCLGYPVFVCVGSGLKASPKWGGIIGLGSQINEEEAIQSAFLECIRNVASIVMNGLLPTLEKSEFENIPKPTSSDRQRLSQNLNYWKEVLGLFPEAGFDTIPSRFQKHDRCSWIVEKLDCPFDELKGAPIVLYRARFAESSGQALYRAKDRSPTTLSRLSEFLQKPVDPEELETLPHFLG